MSLRRLLLALVVPLVAGGCSTQRTLTIESAPPGAHVWVNGEDRGRTPVKVPFVHYGFFEVRLEMEGYEAVQTEVEVPAKIDGYPIVDLPFELVVRDRQFAWRANLKPIPHADERTLAEVLGEANAFREQTRREAVPDAPPPPDRPRPRERARTVR